MRLSSNQVEAIMSAQERAVHQWDFAEFQSGGIEKSFRRELETMDIPEEKPEWEMTTSCPPTSGYVYIEPDFQTKIIFQQQRRIEELEAKLERARNVDGLLAGIEVYRGLLPEALQGFIDGFRLGG